MRLSRKIPALLLAGLGLLALGWLGAVGATVADLGRQGSAERMNMQARELHRVLDEAQHVALAKAELLAGWPDLDRAAAGKRHALLRELLLPVFAVQSRRHGVDQLDVFDGQGVTLLRAQAPEEAGDSVVASRPLVAAALRAREPMAAVAVARTGPAISAVAPLPSGGLVEVGIDPARIVRHLHETSGVEAAILFDRSVLDERAPAMSRRLAADQVVGRYQCLHVTDWSAVTAGLSDHVRGTVREPATFLTRDEEGTHSVALLPLKDQEGEAIGMLVSVQRLDVIRDRMMQLLVPVVAGGAIVGILGAALVLGVSNGLLVRPVRDLAQRLAALADGGEPAPAPDLAARPDEVGDLARAYERLRQGRPDA